jgi:hypothetical protein
MKSVDIGLIELFDRHLEAKGLTYKASIIGGTAIMLVADGQRATGDIDSLQRIPDNIRAEIASFAAARGLEPAWFNDNASRNFKEFVRKGEEVFATLVFEGKALKLYMPSIKTLLLSKIYPMLDRPEEGKDLQDIDSLVVAKIVGRKDLEEAVTAFEDNIRFEDREVIKPSRELASALRAYIEETFDSASR